MANTDDVQASSHPTNSAPATHITTMPTSFSVAVTIKLDRSNYSFWLAQFVPILRSRDLMGYVDGSIPFPSQYISGTTTVSPAYLDAARPTYSELAQ
ncbi:hypothetical protein CerSpe_276120 [Prunus speciosa]